jgi:hypothetical protein
MSCTISGHGKFSMFSEFLGINLLDFDARVLQVEGRGLVLHFSSFSIIALYFQAIV